MPETKKEYQQSEYGFIKGNWTIDRAGGTDVLTAARARIEEIYQKYDQKHILVSFSGGKDSSVALYLALEGARRHKKLPLRVAMFDEEVIDPDTIEYVQRVANNPDFEFNWFCVEIIHTLKSQLRSHWVTWDSEAKDVWARPMPETAIKMSDFPEYRRGMSIREACALYFGDNMAVIGGIRVEESFNRLRSLVGAGSWCVSTPGGGIWAKPVFDWKWQDVWRYLTFEKLDHSKYYDRMWMSGVNPHMQRVAPWGNTSGIRSIPYYQSFYPDFWEKVMIRLPEVKAQSRYGDTKMFRQMLNKPAHLTWREYAFVLVEQNDSEAERKYWYDFIESVLKRWRKYSNSPFPEEEMRVGKRAQINCWKRICKAIQKNDLFMDSSGHITTRETF